VLDFGYIWGKNVRSLTLTPSAGREWSKVD